MVVRHVPCCACSAQDREPDHYAVVVIFSVGTRLYRLCALRFTERFNRMDARVITGTALVIVQAIILIPLVIELRRTRSAKGVSLTSEVAWIIAGVGWSLYGLSLIHI